METTIVEKTVEANQEKSSSSGMETSEKTPSPEASQMQQNEIVSPKTAENLSKVPEHNVQLIKSKDVSISAPPIRLEKYHDTKLDYSQNYYEGNIIEGVSDDLEREISCSDAIKELEILSTEDKKELVCKTDQKGTNNFLSFFVFIPLKCFFLPFLGDGENSMLPEGKQPSIQEAFVPNNAKENRINDQNDQEGIKNFSSFLFLYHYFFYYFSFWRKFFTFRKQTV